jgi:hypothetical protein
MYGFVTPVPVAAVVGVPSGFVYGFVCPVCCVGCG